MNNSIVTFNPIRDLERFDRFFSKFFDSPYATDSGSAVHASNAMVPLDIYEHDGKVYIRAAVPGVKPEELDISVTSNVLTIRGEIKREETHSDARVFRSELAYGSFSRSLRLPDDLIADQVEAEFENGFVTISIPRRQPVEPESIKVPVKSK